MHYFITSSEDVNSSAIEVAQVKRMKMFDKFHANSAIIELGLNDYHKEAQDNLNNHGRVLNMFQLFQKLPYHEKDNSVDLQIVNSYLVNKQFKFKNNGAYDDNGNLRIFFNWFSRRLRSVTLYDRWGNDQVKHGFINRVDHYDNGCLSYSEFFEDKGRLVTREFFNGKGQPCLTYYFRGGENNVPVLTLIELDYKNKAYMFDSEDELRAMFLDIIIKSDPNAVFYFDRPEFLATLPLIQRKNKRYFIFHEAFTEDGKPKGTMFDSYKQIPNLLKSHQLNGLIASTDQECQELANTMKTSKVYSIPVTYSKSQPKVDFSQREKGKIIAVARIDPIKQLDQLISVVSGLHKLYPEITLHIYGSEHAGWDPKLPQKLRQQVKELKAESYIKFEGYHRNMDRVYDSAQLEVLTSKTEGFSMALLEAQEHGCPVVSYNINYGPKEIIKNGVSGDLIQPNNTEMLFEDIRNLYKNPKRLALYSKNAYLAAKRYSFDQVSANWQNFLHQENLSYK